MFPKDIYLFISQSVYMYISTMIMIMIEILTEICHTCVKSTKLDVTGSIYLLVDYYSSGYHPPSSQCFGTHVV